MKTIRQFLVVALLACLGQLMLPGDLLACPTCKDGLHADGTAAAYAVSILFMMGMPFVILSCWVTTIVRLRSKAELICPSLDESAFEIES